jgi:ABC-type multidrug transport system fused ATPase/permease subunit
MAESTVITIAHRLEAVRNADAVLVLGEGRVVEFGPTEEVLGRRRRG